MHAPRRRRRPYVLLSMFAFTSVRFDTKTGVMPLRISISIEKCFFTKKKKTN